MSIPFHKQTDPNKQAGQVVFSPPVPNTGFDREPYLKHSNAAPDVTLSDYIKRKQEGPPRITFDEYMNQTYGFGAGRYASNTFTLEQVKVLWNTALTKGKL